MGCILHEMVFLKKAFGSDNAVYDYYLGYNFDGECLTFTLDTGVFPDDTFRCRIEDLLDRTLAVEYKRRPTAVELLEIFESILSTSTEIRESGHMSGIANGNCYVQL
jgi:hypothetical protein